MPFYIVRNIRFGPETFKTREQAEAAYIATGYTKKKDPEVFIHFEKKQKKKKRKRST